MNHKNCSKYMGMATINEVSYALHHCNGERLWVSRVGNDVPIYEATISQVKKMLWGKPYGLLEKTMRAAYNLFIALP